MRIHGALTLIACVLMTGWWCSALAADTPLPFKAEITIREKSLNDALFKERGVFLVDTTITNTSDKIQNITVWTQQGWSWISDTTDIAPGIEALKNAPAIVILNPGQSYDGGVEIFSDAAAKKPLTFKLGFYPNAEVPISGQPGFAALYGSEIVWSNPVTLAPSR